MSRLAGSWSRRLFLSLVSTTPLLNACRPPQRGEVSQQPGRPELKPAEIRTYEWPPQPDQDAMKAIAEAYQQRQGKITVTVEQPSGDHYEKLQAVLAGGVGPDLINTQSWRWQPFAAKEALVPLDKLRSRDRFDVAWPKQWEKMYEPQTVYRGKLYARPYHWGSVNIFYAKEVFDRFGVPYPSPEWTFAEFLETARRLTRPDGDTQYYGFQSVRIYTRWLGFMRMQGETEWDRLVEPMKAQWHLRTIMEALDFLLYESFHTVRVSPTLADQGRGAVIEQGRCAMKVEGPWFFPSMWGERAARAGGVPFDVAPLPKGRTGQRVTAAVGHVHTINAQTKELEAAWDFMKFIASDEAQEIVVRITGRQPITPEQNQRIWAPLVQQLYNFTTADTFIRAFDYGQFHFTGELDEGFLFRESGLNDALTAMINGEKRAMEVIPDANRRMQQLLDEYWARQKR